MFYILYMSLLNESIHDRVYGIHFMEDQLRIIQELLEMTNTWNENQDKYRSDRGIEAQLYE